MRKKITVFSIFFLSLAIALSLARQSEATTFPGELKREVRREIREEVRERNQGLLQNIKNKIKTWAGRITGELKAIDGSILTVAGSDGKSYQVTVTSNTQVRRRFWGKSELSEFSVGDKLNIIGKWTNEEKTQMEARLVRNLSIQKRWGVFFGKVTQKNNDNFVMETVKRETQTVYFGSGTKFVNRRGEEITYNDLQLGHRVRIKGVWDRTLSKIIDVEEVKDFSLPPQPIRAVTPTSTP